MEIWEKFGILTFDKGHCKHRTLNYTKILFTIQGWHNKEQIKTSAVLTRNTSKSPPCVTDGSVKQIQSYFESITPSTYGLVQLPGVWHEENYIQKYL